MPKLSRLALLLSFVATTLFSTPLSAARYQILYSFMANSIDGGRPYGGVVFDAAGNLYGTTFADGKYQGGTVFELSPQTGGGWTETILHNFSTGQQPWAGLAIDAAGNLYGTTTQGGAFGQGIVFELSPTSGGGWTYTRLHSFGAGKDGQGPYGALVMDAAGNLYGTTMGGGAFQQGTVFELSPVSGGGWSEKILHHFNDNGQDGTGPAAGVTFDSAGNLYGTTFKGGSMNVGTVYRLSSVSGGWAYKVLHTFGTKASDGQYPWAGVIVDAAANIYGTTENGGEFGQGMVFALMPGVGGGYSERTLRNFHDRCCDIFNGTYPLGPLVMDAAGNLYGTTQQGDFNNLGIVFELTPAATGPWPETQLHEFGIILEDGSFPYAGLTSDKSGNLYGTTNQGGANDIGTVFEITP